MGTTQIKEHIEVLENEIKKTKIEKVIQTFKAAIELFKQEIPVPPVLDTYEISNGGLLYEGIYFRCGKCNNEIEMGLTYCCECSHKIDWVGYKDDDNLVIKGVKN